MREVKYSLLDRIAEEGAQVLLGLNKNVFAWYKKPKLIRRIIELSPEAVKQTYSNGQLPLHLAVAHPDPDGKEKKQVEIVRMLIKEYPEALRVQDRDGNLPLHIAAKYHNFGIIPLLCEGYGEGARIKNQSGCLPVDLIWTVYFPYDFGASYRSFACYLGLRSQYYYFRRCCKSKTSRVLCEFRRVYPGVLPQKIDDNRPTLHNILYYDVPLNLPELEGYTVHTYNIYYAMDIVIELDPNSARARDLNGDFPLHIFLRQGSNCFSDWLKILIRLIKANPAALLQRCSVTRRLPLNSILAIRSLRFNFGAASDVVSVVATVCPDSLGFSLPFYAVSISLLIPINRRVVSEIKNNSQGIASLLTSAWDKGVYKSIFCQTFHVLSNKEFSHYDVPLFHMLAINGMYFGAQESEAIMLELIKLEKNDPDNSGGTKEIQSGETAFRSKGSLVEADQEGNTPLHMACRAPADYLHWTTFLQLAEVYDVDEHWTANGMFDLCLRGTTNIPVDTHKVLQTKNHLGEIPLHIVLRAKHPGHIKSLRVKKMLMEYPEASVVLDPMTQVYPFMLAAIGDLDPEALDLETEKISCTYLLFYAFLSYVDPAIHFAKCQY